jgi:hypothetical protein
MEQALEGEPRQEAVDPAVRGDEVVVEAGVDPKLEVAPAPIGVDVRRPGQRQGMHPVFVFELVRGVEAVLPAGPRHEAVVASVVAAEAVAQRAQLEVALLPVDLLVLLLGEAAGVAHSLRVEADRGFLRILRVLVLDRGVRPLVRDHADLAEGDLRGEAELRR